MPLLSRYVWDNMGTVMMHRLTNVQSFERVKDAIGSTPSRVTGEDWLELALGLPEDLLRLQDLSWRGHAWTLRVSEAINAPLRYVYDWCTDFREDDPRITGSNSQRKILEKTKKGVIYAQIYEGADRR